ncbi:hypothetical protein LBMAG53_13590 [Planctomycetota bacterium]|nr:hypothetical protein LBMAG53_13590 [Planctomycetota bacterium]
MPALLSGSKHRTNTGNGAANTTASPPTHDDAVADPRRLESSMAGFAIVLCVCAALYLVVAIAKPEWFS